MPALHAHFKYYGVDISTVTFNWFITVYLDAVPFEVKQNAHQFIHNIFTIQNKPNAFFLKSKNIFRLDLSNDIFCSNLFLALN